MIKKILLLLLSTLPCTTHAAAKVAWAPLIFVGACRFKKEKGQEPLTPWSEGVIVSSKRDQGPHHYLLQLWKFDVERDDTLSFTNTEDIPMKSAPDRGAIILKDPYVAVLDEGKSRVWRSDIMPWSACDARQFEPPLPASRQAIVMAMQSAVQESEEKYVAYAFHGNPDVTNQFLAYCSEHSVDVYNYREGKPSPAPFTTLFKTKSPLDHPEKDYIQHLRLPKGNTFVLNNMAIGSTGTIAVGGTAKEEGEEGHQGAVVLWGRRDDYFPEIHHYSCQQLTTGDDSPVYSMAWSADATHLATLSEDGSVRLFDVATGKCILSPAFFQEHMGVGNGCRSIQYLSDGSLLLLGNDGGVFVFRLPTFWEVQRRNWADCFARR